MASVSFSVSYTQDSNSSNKGKITFNGQTREASGRLDVVGSSVSATGFTNSDVPNCGVLTVTIECTRTSNSQMKVEMTFSGNCYGDNSSDTYNEMITVKKTIENVPLNFTP